MSSPPEEKHDRNDRRPLLPTRIGTSMGPLPVILSGRVGVAGGGAPRAALVLSVEDLELRTLLLLPSASAARASAARAPLPWTLWSSEAAESM